jgi:phosphoglycolate phosphatase
MNPTSLAAVRALIFDLDGTLIDSEADLIDSTNAMLRELARPVLPAATISGFIGHGAAKLVARAIAPDADQQQQTHALQVFLRHYEQHKLDQTRAYPGVPETLEKLFPLPMAVLTNKPTDISKSILHALKLSKYFPIIYGGDSFQTKKPDPFGARAILSEFAVAPTAALFIGDSEVDVQTARNAGMLAAAVNYGFGIHDRAATPADFYLDRLTDLVPLLARN